MILPIVVQTILKLSVCFWVGTMVGSVVGIAITNFQFPKGWWRLVPFRVSGWRSVVYPGRIYNVRWTWQNINFDDYRRQ